MTWVKRGAWLLLAAIVLCAVLVLYLLSSSLPRLQGEQRIEGLSAPATIARDALGVVTIDARDQPDAMRALGFVHAQERYFEMDLARRTAAGELSALFGPIAVDLDKAHRMHRMRARVAGELAGLTGDQRVALQAYVEGVNAGLAALRVRPWPYLLLRQAPAPWTAEDTALTGYAMYFDLQDSAGTRELQLARIQPHLPAALFALLVRDGSSWDAPMEGAARGDALLPASDVVDLRTLPQPKPGATAPLALQALPENREVGSNSFAVSGALTRDGRAIVADDMHLGLRAPNIWFRARMRYADAAAPGGKVDVSGFTLPGVPAVIVGSNTHVAWAFTNSYADTADWKRVRPCAAALPATKRTSASQTPTGVAESGATDQESACDPIVIHRESIAVAGDAATTFDVEDSDWGPILQRDADGSALALRWVAHLPGSINFALADFARAARIADAQAIAAATGTPAQNILLADSAGHLAWQVLGSLPTRGAGCAMQLPGTDVAPIDAADPPAGATTGAATGDGQTSDCAPWPISSAISPMLSDLDTPRMWTANNRVVDGAALATLGDAGYGLGARAAQIRDDLAARGVFAERDLLAVQLDDRAVFLQRWWTLLRDSATTLAAKPSPLRELADAAASWQPEASTGSVSYRIVRAWRLAVLERIGAGLLAPAQAAMGEDFKMPQWPQLEGVAWPMVTQRPANLLPPRYTSWDALFADVALQVRDDLAKTGPLAQRTWGERNTARICHPLAAALPVIGPRYLCMPADQLRGDSNMPRVAAPDFGASQRMVVSPGHEADGIIHMPGGQSGHPLSPFWGAGHDDWVHGRPTPFLPGPAVDSMTLVPVRR